MARVLIGKRSDIHVGKLTSVTVGGKQFERRYFATGNICTRRGAKLNEGEICKELICPWHGAKWDLTTGELTWFREILQPLLSYKIVMEDSLLVVEI